MNVLDLNEETLNQIHKLNVESSLERQGKEPDSPPENKYDKSKKLKRSFVELYR